MQRLNRFAKQGIANAWRPYRHQRSRHGCGADDAPPLARCGAKRGTLVCGGYATGRPAAYRRRTERAARSADEHDPQRAQRDAERRQSDALHARLFRKEVEIEVADTGMGMTPEVMSRIFDPFFTTRGVEGTGLGLGRLVGHYSAAWRHDPCGERTGPRDAFLYSPARQSGGAQGSPCPVFAPIMPADAPGTPILVVDDEPIVAGVLSSILGRHGYRVTRGQQRLRSSGKTARARCRFPNGDDRSRYAGYERPAIDGGNQARRILICPCCC